MSSETLKTLTKTYLALPLSEYTFIWQGGEPTLMGHGFYSTALRLQKKYGRQGAIVRNCLQTNGTLLTPDFAKFLAQHNFLIGLSLDGGQSLHDTYRVFPSGKGSYCVAQKHLELLRKHGASVNALTLVTSNTANRMPELFDSLLEKNFQYHQYIPCVEWTAEGQLQPWSLRSGQWGEALCALFDIWWPRRFDVSVRYFDALMSKLAFGTPGICHAADRCDQYVVVEHDGQVFPCDFYVQPQWALGNVHADSWETMLNNPLRHAFAAHKAPPQPCGDCPYVKLCAGDCPKHRRNLGDDTGKSWLCADYQRFFVHALPRLTRLVRCNT